jgi:hypothetical protein
MAGVTGQCQYDEEPLRFVDALAEAARRSRLDLGAGDTEARRLRAGRKQKGGAATAPPSPAMNSLRRIIR